MVVYKVVRKDAIGFISAVMIPNDGEFFQRYEIGETAYPRVGKLFAFKYLTDARRFLAKRMETGYWFYILECTTTGCRSISRVAHSLECYRFREFWNGDMPKRDEASAPIGTVACNDITPIRVMEGGDFSEAKRLG